MSLSPKGFNTPRSIEILKRDFRQMTVNLIMFIYSSWKPIGVQTMLFLSQSGYTSLLISINGWQREKYFFSEEKARKKIK